jgi:hypothetical protein
MHPVARVSTNTLIKVLEENIYCKQLNLIFFNRHKRGRKTPYVLCNDM